MNSFGRLFRISLYGGSHSDLFGILIDGVPSGIAIDEADFFEDIERRKPNSLGTTSRKECDMPKICSGIYNNFSTGEPINIQFQNSNVNRKDYTQFKNIPRPGHTDFVSHEKYFGFSDMSGSSMFSGRMTLPIVAAGVIAKKIISPIECKSKLLEIGGYAVFKDLVEQALKSGDSLGGIIECIIDNIEIGLGEPFFDSVESVLSHLAFSIPGIKGIEFGAGFQSAKMLGSEFNDAIIDSSGKTKSNHSGGINGGVSNGNPIIFRVAVRPPSSISKPQSSWDFSDNTTTTLIIQGRHDTCFALRMPVIIESIAAIVIADLLLIRKTQLEKRNGT